MASNDPQWEVCVADSCHGVRLTTTDRCWAHADDPEVDAALKRLGEDGDLDARGVRITTALLKRILAATPTTAKGRPKLKRARFSDSTFQDVARFGGVTFEGEAWFLGATFEGEARFFEVTFGGEAWFLGATFEGDAVFAGATFQDYAWFGEATFQQAARFIGATFERDAVFIAAISESVAVFDNVIFEGGVLFGTATFQDAAQFNGAIFEAAREFGPVLVRRQLSFKAATFKQRVRIEAVAATLCADQTRFPAGVHLRLRWAQVIVDDADLAAPSVLAGVPPFAGLDEERLARAWQRLLPQRVRDGRPRLLSLRRADVAGLTVSNVDLRTCRFLGAHNLDKLRAEGNVRFGFTRSALATSRQTIAEEHHWRISRDATGPWSVLRRGWYPAHYQPPDWLEVEMVSPAQVAGLYRALRKGREDNKDEPGAADFYYGEMEMRRHARHEQARQEWQEGNRRTWAAAQTEHAIVWLYWLVSGYGLRAWRALATFGVLLVVSAALFAFIGGFASSTTGTAASPTAT